MEQTYVSKEYWVTKTDFPCLHCLGPIKYRPIPLGVSEGTGGIQACCGFCSWPCARTYADQVYASDAIEALTTRIMADFKATCSAGDDPEGWRYLQSYSRFSQVPRAPPRHQFEPYGPLTHQRFRENWTASCRSERGSLQSSTTEGTIIDTALGGREESSFRSSATEGPPRAEQEYCPRRTATSYSTKRQCRPRVGLNQTYWPALNVWAEAAEREERR